MKRTTIMLPPELHREITRRASESGVSLGEYVRQAVRERLESDSAWKSEDPLLADEAVYRGDAPKDLAAKHDRHLHGGRS